jgi:hypothetical protein
VCAILIHSELLPSSTGHVINAVMKYWTALVVGVCVCVQITLSAWQMFGNVTFPVNLIPFVLDGAVYILCSDDRLSLEGLKAVDPSL